MSDGVHLLIPFASSHAEGAARPLRTLALPQLEKLLARLKPAATRPGDEPTCRCRTSACWRAHAACRRPTGCIPWAALAGARRPAAIRPGTAWACITPCHWRGGPATTSPWAIRRTCSSTPRDRRRCWRRCSPSSRRTASRWNTTRPRRGWRGARCFATCATASLDRVVGRTIDDWMPRAPEARTLRRLQQEMQMLLYTHAGERRARSAAACCRSIPSGSAAPARCPPARRADAPRGPAGHPLPARCRPCADDWHGLGRAPGSSSTRSDCAGLLRRADAGERRAR